VPIVSVLSVRNTVGPGSGIAAFGTTIGLYGESFIGAGVYGINNASGSGIQGLSATGTGILGGSGTDSFHVPGVGVVGNGPTAGVTGLASANSASGVVGLTNNYSVPASIKGGSVGGSNLAAHPGVSGYHGGNGTGVQGASASGIGVFGATNGPGQVAGIYGVSNASYGVIDTTTAAGYPGLTKITGTTGVAALAATSTNAGAYAAYFRRDRRPRQFRGIWRQQERGGERRHRAAPPRLLRRVARILVRGFR
jgi:hypothetical protein